MKLDKNERHQEDTPASVESMITQKMVDALNSAFEADPLAMRVMMINMIPCNQKLADHPTMPVQVFENGYTVTALGFINGALEAAGLKKIASKWSDTKDSEGRYTLLGFQAYDSP